MTVHALSANGKSSEIIRMPTGI